jgi:hypothetical protein
LCRHCQRQRCSRCAPAVAALPPVWRTASLPGPPCLQAPAAPPPPRGPPPPQQPPPKPTNYAQAASAPGGFAAADRSHARGRSPPAAHDDSAARHSCAPCFTPLLCYAALQAAAALGRGEARLLAAVQAVVPPPLVRGCDARQARSAVPRKALHTLRSILHCRLAPRVCTAAACSCPLGVTCCMPGSASRGQGLALRWYPSRPQAAAPALARRRLPAGPRRPPPRLPRLRPPLQPPQPPPARSRCRCPRRTSTLRSRTPSSRRRSSQRWAAAQRRLRAGSWQGRTRPQRLLLPLRPRSASSG